MMDVSADFLMSKCSIHVIISVEFNVKLSEGKSSIAQILSVRKTISNVLRNVLHSGHAVC